MKVITYEHQGTMSYGVADGDGVIDAGAALKARYPDLLSLLEGEALDELRQATEGQAASAALGDITFLPVIPDTPKIVLVGLNYEAHRIETGREKSEYPVLFSRYADCQVGHEQPMIKPKVSDAFDFEGELAVIIGKTGRYISEADSLGYIAGYSCYNDGSIRDYQRHTHQFLPGKNFPGTGAFGPWMVTADELPDPTAMTLVTRLNGEEMQRATTDTLTFTIPELIAYISQWTELHPGELIITGTPGGVGFTREPPVFMKEGDVIEVDISGIGVLRNPIANG
jgi:2-keto-4-pentenoate hydratase/2-oxohepta-3-ene-1,7-dioic acid hydratase in catechol pathway